MHTVKTVSLDRRIITDEEYNAIKAESEKYAGTLVDAAYSPTIDTLRDFTRPLAEFYRRKEVLDRYEKQKLSPYEKTEIHTIRIGDVAFATNPFELYIDYQHRIQKPICQLVR